MVYMRMKSIISLTLLIAVAASTLAHAEDIKNADLAITLESSGHYKLHVTGPDWIWAGQLPSAAHAIKTDTGKDAVGEFNRLRFEWDDSGRAMTGSIRVYTAKDVVLFSDTLTAASITPASPFPNFTSVPAGLSGFSYKNAVFAPAQFSLKTTSSPWLLFDKNDQAILLSAANHLLITNLIGDGQTTVASGYTAKLANLPAGFEHQTIFAYGPGINKAFDLWGHALTDLQGKIRPPNDADTQLRYYGIWTDNGGYYYYNYDLAKGYAKTLVDLVSYYRDAAIPVRYLQLDSWWYYKTFTSPNGKEGKTKNPKLPEGEWNRYGGLLEYKPHTFLFPNGLEPFYQQVKVPFITHNRWIDPTSPYHQRFKISGVAAVDPKFWDEIAGFLKTNHIETYEQDWLNQIFENSPELSSTTDQGDALLDNMARATKEQGRTVQYCMALPRCILQISKYDNVTATRVSGDRFQPSEYHQFLYGSRLAGAVGTWPWTDVFMSTEMNNLLLCNLSAGPLGTGDAIGKESRENLFKTIRADGVIVKPDEPAVPIDATYLKEAAGDKVSPLVVSTFSQHAGLRCLYVAIVGKPGASYTVSAADLSIQTPSWAYDYFAASGAEIKPGDTLQGTLDGTGVNYRIIVPEVGGIYFMGDADKLVSLGKQRIADVQNKDNGLEAEVLFAADDKSVTLHGYTAKAPSAIATGGTASAIQYDAQTKHFTCTITPDATLAPVGSPDPVRKVQVTLTIP